MIPLLSAAIAGHSDITSADVWEKLRRRPGCDSLIRTVASHYAQSGCDSLQNEMKPRMGLYAHDDNMRS
jgi:hypothetical protein